MKYAVKINENSYKEVDILYRKYRAEKIENKGVLEKENKHVCPMVEAGRSTDAYRKKFIPGLKSNDLQLFADALEVSPSAMKLIAYFSGNKSSVIGNIISGKFNDKEITNGFIHTLKKGVHTGIYKEGKFNQERFNKFVWAFYPDLKNISFTKEWLYSSKADNLYLDERHLKDILSHNQTYSTHNKVSLGVKLSAFEMEKLLLGVLGQELENYKYAKKGILIRDIFDLYKYGFVPASVEEKFLANDLIEVL